MCDFEKVLSSCECDLEICSVFECNQDISNHLYGLKSSGAVAGQTSYICPEYLVLLYRSVYFVIDKTVLSLQICTNHRKRLGIAWRRPRRTCAYPDHVGNIAADRGASPSFCKEVWLQTGQILPVGSALCKKCCTRHKKEVAPLYEVNYNEELGIIGQIADQLRGSREMLAAACIKNTDIEASMQNPSEVECDEMNDSSMMNTDTGTDNENACSQLTSCSNWSQDAKSDREIFNEAVEALSHSQYEPLKSQPSQPLAELHSLTRKFYIRQATSALQYVCESIAPGQGATLFDEVIMNNKPKMQSNIRTDALTETVIEAYKKADDHNTRKQILSLIANKYTKSELLTLIDGLSVYKIDMARRHASTHGPGQYITPPKVTRVRLTKGKLQHFIEFISTLCYLQTVAFGSKILKLSSGVQVKVPKVMYGYLYLFL